ncbi:hypothetical protein FB451DRAFT_1185929 [Mycena latifolia]|nr:hypothetical protein FB451DRAFT_1185929 [Mycena latifolia]
MYSRSPVAVPTSWIDSLGLSLRTLQLQEISIIFSSPTPRMRSTVLGPSELELERYATRAARELPLSRAAHHFGAEFDGALREILCPFPHLSNTAFSPPLIRWPTSMLIYQEGSVPTDSRVTVCARNPSERALPAGRHGCHCRSIASPSLALLFHTSLHAPPSPLDESLLRSKPPLTHVRSAPRIHLDIWENKLHASLYARPSRVTDVLDVDAHKFAFAQVRRDALQIHARDSGDSSISLPLTLANELVSRETRFSPANGMSRTTHSCTASYLPWFLLGTHKPAISCETEDTSAWKVHDFGTRFHGLKSCDSLTIILDQKAKRETFWHQDTLYVHQTGSRGHPTLGESAVSTIEAFVVCCYQCSVRQRDSKGEVLVLCRESGSATIQLSSFGNVTAKNLTPLERHQFTPAPTVIIIISEAGLDATATLDAHKPNVGRHSSSPLAGLELRTPTQIAKIPLVARCPPGALLRLVALPQDFSVSSAPGCWTFSSPHTAPRFTIACTTVARFTFPDLPTAALDLRQVGTFESRYRGLRIMLGSAVRLSSRSRLQLPWISGYHSINFILGYSLLHITVSRHATA